jgi:hypothetical protein
MAIAVTHNVVVATANDAGYEVSRNAWNDGHALSMATSRVLGRTTSGAGAVEELKGMWVEVSRATASNSTSIDFTGIDSTADEWMVAMYNVLPATDGDFFGMRTSTNGGSSYDAGGSDYNGQTISGADPSITANQPASSDGIYLSTDGVGTASNETGYQGEIFITTPTSAQYCQVFFEAAYIESTSGGIVQDDGYWRRLTAADVDAVRFYFESGNIASGTFVLYKRLK